MRDTAEESTHIGIHLSGANTPRTSVVVLQTNPKRQLVIGAVYEKIASYGSLFSDERLLEIVRLAGPVDSLFIDAPLTASPCEMCTRDICPGALRCEDLAVAYLLKLNEEERSRGRRRKRPLNPQSQRLWDVALSMGSGRAFVEPSFDSNKAPLMTRARALAKRLKSLSPAVVVKETSVPHTLAALGESVSRLQQAVRAYRNFENGLTHRRTIVTRLIDDGWLAAAQPHIPWCDVYDSLENFQGFVCALVSYLHKRRLTVEPPDAVYAEQGWVYIPERWKNSPEATSGKA